MEMPQTNFRNKESTAPMNKLLVAIRPGFFLCIAALLTACGGGGDGEHGGRGVTLPPTTGLLTSLSITPAASSVAACSPVQYTATGTYSDNTIVDVTNGVYWEIDPASSDVAIADTWTGQFVGIKTGSARVNAWTGSGIAASAVLNVASDSLNSIAITPASSTLAATATQSYTATATCSNGTLDISRMNIWTSSAPAVATISVTGVATAVATGSTTITASAGTVAASGVLSVP